jgi:hypothetical protein
MSTPQENPEFEQFLNQLAEATRSGTVKWNSVNPTTFVWETPNGKLTLQRVVQRVNVQQVRAAIPGRPPQVVMVPQEKVNHIFQASQKTGAELEQVLSINSSEHPGLSEKLEALFQLVSQGVSEKALDFLKSLLPPR